MGAPRSTPALRLAAFDSTLNRSLAADRADRNVGLRLLTSTEPRSSPSPSSWRGSRGAEIPWGCPRSMPTWPWTAKHASRSAPTGSGRSAAAPPCRWTPTPGVAGPSGRPASTTRSTSAPSGILGRRIHVNVDFDTEREYSSNNDVQIYYEGLEDEIVRRVDVGTVTFQPPPSRFITAAVPANNFGVNAVFDLGPIQLQTLAATQKGSVVAERTYTIGQTTSQPQDRQARDLDFESGRFFWVVDPDSVPGTPAVDILDLDPRCCRRPTVPRGAGLPLPSGARATAAVNPNLGGITAWPARRHPRAATPGPLGAADPGHRLLPGRFGALDRPGHEAGSDRLPGGELPDGGGNHGRHLSRGGPGARLQRRARADRRAAADPGPPQLPPRDAERVSGRGTDLDPASLEVSVTLNRSERPVSRDRRRPTSSSSASRSRTIRPCSTGRTGCGPRARDPEAAEVVGDPYIVFPHLEPFADPTRLSPPEISDSIYRTPIYLLLPRARPPNSRFGCATTRREAATARPQSQRAPGEGGQRAALRRRPQARARTWTTGSHTMSVKSPSSIPSCCSVRAPPRSPPDSRSGGSSRWPRPRSSASPPAIPWVSGVRSTSSASISGSRAPSPGRPSASRRPRT